MYYFSIHGAYDRRFLFLRLVTNIRDVLVTPCTAGICREPHMDCRDRNRNQSEFNILLLPASAIYIKAIDYRSSVFIILRELLTF